MKIGIYTHSQTDLPANNEDVYKAALQYVRNVSGFQQPSKASEPAFTAAVNEITAVSMRLLESLNENAPLQARTRAIDIRYEPD